MKSGDKMVEATKILHKMCKDNHKGDLIISFSDGEITDLKLVIKNIVADDINLRT